MKRANKYTILAVDDAKDSLMLLEFDLTEYGYHTLTVDSGESALSVLENTPVSLILLDMYMPGMSGLEILKKIKSQPNLSSIPVIMLSASDDEEQIVAALEYGADDYVTKPYIFNVLLARIRTSLRLMEKTKELEVLATTDYLTELNNRRSFNDLCTKVLNQVNRAQQPVSLAMFDLDFFKQVNDSYGHDAGDKVLISFAKLLNEVFRDYDIIGRIGGEEFAVIMPNTSSEDAFIACERCRDLLAKETYQVSFKGRKHNLSVSVSVGITEDKCAMVGLEEMLRVADIALYRAKENGRNQSVIEICLPTDTMNNGDGN